VVYFVVAKLSLLTAIPPGYATSVWPPSGMALAAILLVGNRVWPGIWIGAALANLTVASSPVASILIGSGNAMEALAAAALIRRFIGTARRFERGEDVFKFVAIAASASMIAATVGTVSIAADGAIAWTDFLTHWWTWWQGDTSGIILVTPLILVPALGWSGKWSTQHKIELVAFAIALALAGFIAFGSVTTASGFSPLLLVLTLPLVIWAAFRFDQREVVLAIATLAAFAVGFTVAGRGPLASTSVDVSLVQLLIFTSVVAVTGLVISAVVGERRRAMEALRRSRDELERRVAERTHAFKRSEETFRMLVEGIQDYAIFMLDPNGNIVSWNKGAAKIKGYTADEIIGQHFSRFYPAEAIERYWPQQELELAKAQGRFEDTGWRIRKDGSQFWANVIITALYDADGQLRGFAKITRDMTESRRVETLERNERRMNEFLAMLAHELRNPLAPIRNALDLMRMKSADTSIQEWSRNVIDRQTTQLTRLVDDLLDIGRITSGKIVLKKEPVELTAAVMRAVESCQPIADRRDQTLEVHCGTDPLMIDGDLIRLSQIVTNLLNNAIKYTPDGGKIEVSVTREGDSAVVRVKDSGIGIPPDLIPDVFNLFIQGERSLARTEGGLGIGLTIVRQLVALHGGSVTARSEGQDKGSEFTVRLPALPQKSSARKSVPFWQPQQPQVKRRVLVVDDNHDSADMMAAVLNAWGHDVRTEYDGHAAIAAASQFRPEVVLLDIGLPGMNGYDVAMQLRKSAHLQPPVLVAVTGYGQDEDRQRVREAGFDHHLIKPVDPAALEKIIEALHAPATPS
jgi:PAS domain S-box-containing protein